MPANATYRVSGYCHGGRDQAAVLIFNGETAAQRTFVVHSFNFREANPTPVTATTWNIYRTTAQSGGEAVNPFALDTSSSAVPSQVQIATQAEVTQGSYLFGRLIIPTGTASVGVPCLGGMSPASAWARTDAGTVLDGRGFSDTQVITLHEGEGVAFMNSSSSDSPTPAMWQLLAQIRIGSATYSISTTIAPVCGLGAFAVHNGTGSGVVVEVLSLQLVNVGPPTVGTINSDAATVRLARIFGGFTGGGAVTPVSYSGSPAPTQLQVLRHQDWNPLNVVQYLMSSKNGLSLTDLGVPGTTTIPLTQQRQIGVYRHFITYTNNLFNLSGATTGAIGTSFAQGRGNGMSFSGAVPDISKNRLNPGEGLALIVDNPTSYGLYYFEAEIIHEPPQVMGTSPSGYTS